MNSTDPRRGWPLKFDFFRSPPISISSTALVVGLIFLITLIAIAALAVSWLLIDLVSGDQKRAAEASKTALPVFAAAIGLPLLIWRLVILDRQTKISEQKTQIDRETHYTSIFSRSIEQLGQTRELKRNTATNGTNQEITTTVPNIEMRLGGIHSLTRLAEESLKDRSKTKNILRSYIRENSWSDRDGEQSKAPAWERNSNLYKWIYGEEFGDAAKEIEDAQQEWRKFEKSRLYNLSRWASAQSETRVDVNEAIDALNILLNLQSDQSNTVLTESLFVERNFSKEILARLAFRRCHFVRCSFNLREVDRLDIVDSKVISSTFYGHASEMTFKNSKISDSNFVSNRNSKLTLDTCEGNEIKVVGAPTKFALDNCVFSKLDFRGVVKTKKPLSIKIDLIGTPVLIDSVLTNVGFSSESEFDEAYLMNVKLDAVDLSKLPHFNLGPSSSVTATAGTLHPKGTARPKGWPIYDPNYDSDDIPF